MVSRERGVSDRKRWEERAEIFEENLKRHLGDVKVLLLGPGYPEGQLEIRQELGRRLEAEGCCIFIMEELDPITSLNIDEKFRDILDDIMPDLIACIFTKNGSPHGIIFEVGFICGHHRIDHALSRLLFFFHVDLDKIAQIPSYIHGLFARGKYYEFHDEGDGPTLFDRVFTAICNEVVHQYCPTDR